MSRIWEMAELWIGGLSPFYQSILGAAVFATCTWLIRFVLKKSKATGSAFLKLHTEEDVKKHLLHKEYICAKDYQVSVWGTTQALLISAKWAMHSVLFFLFFFAIDAMLDGDWLLLIGAWLTFNGLLEAHSWLKDSSADSAISHIPEDVVERIRAEHDEKNSLLKRLSNDL